MYIEFESLEDILQFADLVCNSLDKSRLSDMSFLTDEQCSRIWYAVYNFMDIYSAGSSKIEYGKY